MITWFVKFINLNHKFKLEVKIAFASGEIHTTRQPENKASMAFLYSKESCHNNLHGQSIYIYRKDQSGHYSF